MIPIPFFNWKLRYFEKKGPSENPEKTHKVLVKFLYVEFGKNK